MVENINEGVNKSDEESKIREQILRIDEQLATDRLKYAEYTQENDSTKSVINNKVDSVVSDIKSKNDIVRSILTKISIMDSQVRIHLTADLDKCPSYVADKFIAMEDDEGHKYIMALPIEYSEFHRDIKKYANRCYKKNLNVVGGGYIVHNDINNLLLYGRSGDYGIAPSWTKDFLVKNLSEINIEDNLDKNNKIHETDNIDNNNIISLF